MKNLLIGELSIRYFEDGLYHLSDVHKLSGHDQKHRPKYWLDTQHAKEYINFLTQLSFESKGGIPPLRVIRGTSKAGTYASEELVLTYAMWCSVKTHHIMITAIKELNSATTTQELNDLKFKYDNSVQTDLFTKHQQPRDKNTLQVILGLTPFQAEQFHNELICDGLLEKIGSKTITQRILGTTPINKMVIGQKGDTLLWDAEALKQYFGDKQTDWTI